jgi:uncharacterized protein (DUF362 family)
MIFVEKLDHRNLKRFIESEIFSHFNKLKEKVLIKPNWGGRLPIIKGENTDTYFLQTLAEIIFEKKVKKIFIAHYPLLEIENEDYSFEKLLKITGVNKVRFPRNTEFLNLDTLDKEEVIIEGFRFHLPKILKDVFYINLAKLKTHMETKVSLCLKNQMGLLPAEDKISMHEKDLEKGIALLAKIIKPNLSIIDGIISMDQYGPHHGRTKKTDIVIYSDDIVEADSLAAFLMGYNAADIKHLRIANSLGVGNMISEDEKDKYKKYRFTNFILPKGYLKKYNFTIWPTTACSRCIFSLDKTQKYLKRDFLLMYKLLFDKNKSYNIVIGRGDNNDFLLSRIIAIGECTKDLASKNNIDYLKGCPPTSKEIFKFIKDKIIIGKNI